MQNPKLAAYFNGKDMTAQTKKTSDFLIKVMGGPDNYQGRELKCTHATLGINKVDFDDAWVCM
jgi:hemoglobin